MPNPTPTPAPALGVLPEEIIDALVLEFGRICYERTRCQGILVCSSCLPWEALSEESRRSWAETWPAEPLREAARTVLTAALSQGVADAALVGGSDTIGVLGEVAAERARQDAQWGGPAHDDEHASWEWRDYRTRYEVRIDLEVDEYDDPADPARVRDALVKIAALAVAQIESLDRFTALSTARAGEASHG